MATTRKTDDVVERGVEQTADVVGGAAVKALDQLGREKEAVERDLVQTRNDLQTEKNQRASERASLQQENRRLQEIVDVLQHPKRAAKLTSAEGSLEYAISYLYAVAVGGPAAELRNTVNQVGRHLDTEGLAKFKDMTRRLRGAAEALDQEATAL